MSANQTVFFIINLPQDVNIVRGLVYLTARETDAAITFLITEPFLKRDRQQIWQREVANMAADTQAAMYLYSAVEDIREVLQRTRGLIIAAAESNLPAHREVSAVFNAAPQGYLRITLQHGLECVGFLQSREHVLSHGRNISFSADVVCGWFAAPALTSLSASERSKLYVSGPPTLLQRRPVNAFQNSATGLVCENLHSVRLRASGDHKTSFMDIFFAFCAAMANCGESITLRPHPGGQYVLKNKIALPSNVHLNTAPTFAVDLSAFRFGVSAPSTIVFDLVLAGVPVGLWRDPAGIMDASNYEGLTEISTLEDWLAFERDVRIRPQMILDRQDSFLRRLSMPLNPEDIYRRFARLIVAGLAGLHVEGTRRLESGAQAGRRLQLSANALVETNA